MKKPRRKVEGSSKLSRGKQETEFRSQNSEGGSLAIRIPPFFLEAPQIKKDRDQQIVNGNR